MLVYQRVISWQTAWWTIECSVPKHTLDPLGISTTGPQAWPLVTRPWVHFCTNPGLGNNHPLSGLVKGIIYRKTPYLMGKSMVSCRFSRKPIHWSRFGTCQKDICRKCVCLKVQKKTSKAPTSRIYLYNETHSFWIVPTKKGQLADFRFSYDLKQHFAPDHSWRGSPTKSSCNRLKACDFGSGLTSKSSELGFFHIF